MPHTLFIVSTPIGNLGDFSFRALRVLQEVSLIACEDTRVTQKLLNHYEISNKLISFHAHSSDEKEAKLIERLTAGEDIALLSDAGTPLISDPGGELVRLAQEHNIQVVPIPGACAILAALAGSGLPTHRFLFLGFLPRNAKDQAEVLRPLRNIECSLVCYESPRRCKETLENCLSTLGDRMACVARELTKKFETFERGLISELLARLDFPLRGEIVIVLAPGEKVTETHSHEEILNAARAHLAAGDSSADIAKALVIGFGIKRKAAYKIVLEAKGLAPEKSV